jgi:molybdopterin/thiamine biosynthesis adenylyltransferase
VPLSEDEKELYSRQIAFLKEAKQMELKSKKVFVLGAGGLGSPVLYYLAGAGVGEITICDFDEVSLSNLNRQILHDYDRIGVNKAESAKQTLSRFNPWIKINVLKEKMPLDRLGEMAKHHDLVIEATDAMAHKEEVNRLLAPEGVGCIHAIVLGMGGFCFLAARETVCLSCLFKKAPVFTAGRALPFEYYPSFGAAAGMLGSMIGIIAMRYLLGCEEGVMNRIFYLSQQLAFKKLMLSARGLKAIMTDHFKTSLQESKKSFPENNTLVTEHFISADPGCQACANKKDVHNIIEQYR